MLNTTAIRQIMNESQAGQLIFPEVVRRLMDAGVESYVIDYARGEETFYGIDADTHVAPMTLPAAAVAEDFSATDIVAAIRGAQADTVRYPEFTRRAAEAGVIGYWAFLTGAKVVYFGRKGEMHVEAFPRNAN